MKGRTAVFVIAAAALAGCASTPPAPAAPVAPVAQAAPAAPAKAHDDSAASVAKTLIRHVFSPF